MGWTAIDDDAVSETLGYILIFMIVLTCIAFILFTGNGVLESAKSQNNFKSMEQGLTVLTSDLKQVALEGTPVKTTRLHMEDGSFSANGSTGKLTITYVGEANFTSNFYPTVNTGSIMFRSDLDGSTVAIENGGVWEKPAGSSGNIVVLEPRIYKTKDSGAPPVQTLVLNVVKLDATPPSSIGGSATMDITLTDEGTKTYSYDASNSPTGKDVLVTFYTTCPDAWGRFFQDNGAGAPTIGSNYVSATFPNISKLIISEHTVGVKAN